MLSKAPLTSQPETPRVSDAFAPEPGPIYFNGHFMELEDLGIPRVGSGRRWGPGAPCARRPIDGAPDPHELDVDVEQVAKAPWESEQPWFLAATAGTRRVDDTNAAEVERRTEAARDGGIWPPSTRWQSKRRPAMCMMASAMVAFDVRRMTTSPSCSSFEAQLTTTAATHAGTGRSPRRSDAVTACWASLGTWPWALFPDAKLPPSWWHDQRAISALADVCAIASRAAEETPADAATRALELSRLAGHGAPGARVARPR